MTTLKDISLHCGVSVATVSKALNGQRDISANTRQRIQKAAKKLGYLPNSSARALKTSRSYNLGVVYEDAQNAGFSHDVFASILNSFKMEAEATGYDITFLSSVARDMTYYEHSRYRGVDGTLLVCCDYGSPQVLELVNSELPIVTIDYTFAGCTSIVSDNIAAMRELAGHILGMGHTRIAYIHGELDDASVATRDRLEGLRQALAAAGLTLPPEYIIPGIYRDVDTTARLTGQLMERDAPPTCIIFPDDYATLGGINYLTEKGLSIPGDISIAGFDGIRLAKVMEPKLTTFEQNTQRVGHLAAKNLIEWIEHPETAAVKKVVVKGRLETGASVARL